MNSLRDKIKEIIKSGHCIDYGYDGVDEVPYETYDDDYVVEQLIDFIRTSDPAHKAAAAEMWRRCAAAGDIYKQAYEGLYCVGCERFLTERDLVAGKCVIHNTEPAMLKEENYFFRLSKYAPEIQRRIESDELSVVPETRKHEILSFIKKT